MPESQLDRIEGRLIRIEQHLINLIALVATNQETTMANFDTLKQKVADEETVVQSVIVLLGELAAEVRSLNPNQQSIDDLANKIDSDRAALAAAVQENTPTPPTP